VSDAASRTGDQNAEEGKLEVVREQDGAGHLTRERMMSVAKGRKPIAQGQDNGLVRERREALRARVRPRRTARSVAHVARERRARLGGVVRRGESAMRFWYENGVLSAEGPARKGSRQGVWRCYRPDGTLREEGTYVNSLREGDWTEVPFERAQGARRLRARQREVAPVGRAFGPRAVHKLESSSVNVIGVPNHDRPERIDAHDLSVVRAPEHAGTELGHDQVEALHAQRADRPEHDASRRQHDPDRTLRVDRDTVRARVRQSQHYRVARLTRDLEVQWLSFASEAIVVSQRALPRGA
jgi:hypothetical protein